MFKFVVLFALLAIAAAAPKKEEKAHITSIKSESEGESSQWRKDNIEKHVEPVVIKKKEESSAHVEIKHEEHHEEQEHHGEHHEDHHGEHHEEQEHHGEHHEEHHGEHQQEHHGEHHHEEHKPEIKKKEIITYKSESEGESNQWRKDNIEKHVEHGHGH